MLIALLNAAVVAFALTLILASVLLWGWGFVRLFQGEELIPWRDRRPAPWSWLGLLVVAGLWLIGQVVAGGLYRAVYALPAELVNWPAEHQAGLVGVLGAVQLLTSLLGVAALAIETRLWGREFQASDLGLGTDRLGEDVLLGFTAYAMLTVPTIAIQAVLIHFYDFESKHPVLEMVKSNPILLWIAAAAAVVGAPLFEEFLFRALFQGTIEASLVGIGGASAPREEASRVVGEAEAGAEVSGEAVAAPDPLDPREAPPPVVNPYPSPADNHDFVEPPLEKQTTAGRLPWPLGWLAILTSSVVFALMHWSHGPDWVALLFLAIGLGYVYQQTHRLLPCLLVHALFNGTSIAMLAIGIATGQLPE